MKQTLFLVIVIALVAFGYVYYTGMHRGDAPAEAPAAATTTETLASEEYGFSLPYRASPRGYVMVMPADAPEGDLLFFRSLFDAEEYAALEESEVPREGPPVITVSVYRNPMSRPAEEWIRTTEASNFALAPQDEIGSVRIGETTYATYQYDGLYLTDAYVFVRDGYAYLFTAGFADAESSMREDLRTMLAGIEWTAPSIPSQTAHNDIVVMNPTSGGAVSSPLTVSGRARGPWFFEASFPLVLVDWDGRIIAEGHATADGEWMTEEFVDFTGTLEFEKPAFDTRGTLILRKDNPSGLPEHDDAIEVSVVFE